jgi:protein TonB
MPPKQKRRPPPRRPFVPVGAPPKSPGPDRSLAPGLLLALAVNGALAGWFFADPERRELARDAIVEFVVEEATPPPPPEPTPEPPKPKVVDMQDVNKPKPTDAAEEPPPEPPKPVFGVSMESVVGANDTGLAVRVGNTIMKDPETELTKPEEVQPLRQVSFQKLEEPPKLVQDYVYPQSQYPKAALDAGIEGTVVLKLTVDEKGRVTDVKVVRGVDAELDRLAKEAAYRFVYKPGRSGGEPVITTNVLHHYRWEIVR